MNDRRSLSVSAVVFCEVSLSDRLVCGGNVLERDRHSGPIALEDGVENPDVVHHFGVGDFGRFPLANDVVNVVVEMHVVSGYGWIGSSPRFGVQYPPLRFLLGAPYGTGRSGFFVP